MKFFKDVLICLVGLVLLISTLVTVFAAIGYLKGASSGDALLILQVSVPIMVVSSVIAWREREVLGSALAWMFPF